MNQSGNIHLIMGAMLALIYGSLFLIERFRPLRTPVRSLLSRIVVNISITVLVFISASIFISPLAKSIIHPTSIHGFGLLSLLPLNSILLFVIGFLLMDLTFYYWHRLNHELPLLWRFHNVHHIDPDLDVTTSMRFHVVEIAYSSLFRLVQLSLIGIEPLTFVCYEFVFQASTFFQHSNIKLPIRFERLINKIIVTPRMHGIHHSNYRNETNSNYSVIFSFWDRLHRTIQLNVPQQSVTVGVPGFKHLQDNTFKNLMLMPFKAQRPYWQTNQLARPVNEDDKDSGFLCE